MYLKTRNSRPLFLALVNGANMQSAGSHNPPHCKQLIVLKLPMNFKRTHALKMRALLSDIRKSPFFFERSGCGSSGHLHNRRRPQDYLSHALLYPVSNQEQPARVQLPLGLR